jgi:glycosyltransferase involved in cell wall biosynthesis
MKRICLVTSAHISYNPRIVKEADALSEAGYEVSVIALTLEDSKVEIDMNTVHGRLWTFRSLDVRRNKFPAVVRWLRASLRQWLCRKVLSGRSAQGTRDRAYSRYLGELTRASQLENAELYIAHNLPALPAAAAAASTFNSKLGFDAEDYHRGEFRDTTSSDFSLTKQIEEYYIPRCDYLTAASVGIADAYLDALNVRRPIPILNVFSRTARNEGFDSSDIGKERRGTGLSLYWCSQTIGSDRGLDDALEAIQRLRPFAHLHIRGTWAEGYEDTFMQRVRELDIAKWVHVAAAVPPNELIARAAQHDVGLALEPGDRPNNRIAASNKLFTYLSAGIAVAATNVPGQADVLREIDGAGFLYPPGQSEALAAGLRQWLDHPAQLLDAKQQSNEAGKTRYCWEVESKKLVYAVTQLLNRRED